MKQGNAYTKLYTIHSGVSECSVLGPILYLLHIADLPTSLEATIAEDTTALASASDPIIASKKLQNNLNAIRDWLKMCRIQANETKSTHVTFALHRGKCPRVMINNHELQQEEDVKYLGMQLDRRFTGSKHIFSKRKHLGLK